MLSTAILRASSQHRVCLPQFIVAGAVLLGPPPSSVCATRCWVECGRASGANGKRRQPIHAPPVFILVCKNTAIAKVLYEWLAEDKRPHIAAGQYRRIQGVLYDDYVQAHAVVVPGPPLEHGCSQRGQIVLKMAMSLEDRSEEVGHGEHNADKGNIRQCGSLFSLPELGASIAAARATIRFAGVIEDLLTGRGGVNFATESRWAATLPLCNGDAVDRGVGGLFCDIHHHGDVHHGDVYAIHRSIADLPDSDSRGIVPDGTLKQQVSENARQWSRRSFDSIIILLSFF